MSITILGYIAILITIFALLKRDKYILLYATIFFSGFTGSSVVNVAGVSIQPSYYFFIMFMLFSITRFYKFRLPKYYLFFLIYIVINSFFPIFLSRNQIWLMQQSGEYGYLTYSSSNLIHAGYMIFMFVLFTYLYNIKDDAMHTKIVKWYKYGLFGFIIVILYQLIAFQFNLPFDELFRQGVHGNVQGTRLYGPCGEASMMCYYLAPSLLFLWIYKNKTIDLVFWVIGMILGVMSYSSTFLIGAAISLVIIFIHFFRRINKKFKLQFIIGIMFIGLFAVIFISLNNEMITKLITGFNDKLNLANQSGIERSESFYNMIKIGLEHPFGVGFGSARSKDLFSTWGCNIGIIGLGIVFIGIIYIYIYIYQRKRQLSFINSCPFYLVVILMMISVPEPYAMFIQILLYFTITKNKCLKQN